MEKNTGEKKNRIDKKTIKKINSFLIKNFKFIIILIVIIVLLLGSYFVLYKKYNKIMVQSEAASEEQKSEYDNQLKYLQELQDLKSVYETISQKDIDKVLAILPDEQTHEDLLSQVETIILKNGLLLKSLSVEAEGKDKSQRSISTTSGGGNKEDSIPSEIGKVKINMSIIGTDYERFKQLLFVLENNLRLMDIDNLSFSPNEKSTTLSLVTYYLKK